MKSLTSLCLVFFKHFKGYQFEYVFNLHWELRTTDLTSGGSGTKLFWETIRMGIPWLAGEMMFFIASF